MGYQFTPDFSVKLGNIKGISYKYKGSLFEGACSETRTIEGNNSQDENFEKVFSLKVLRTPQDSVSLSVEQLEKKLEAYKDGINSLGASLVVPIQDTAAEQDGSDLLAGVVTQYIPGATLRSYLSLEKDKEGFANKTLPGEQIKEILQNLISCVEKIHEKGMVHGNLKPQNIIVESDKTMRLLDFAIPGLPRNFCPNGAPDEAREKLAWTAPELLIDPTLEASKTSDIWSIGVILSQMLHGRHPFEGASPEDLLKLIKARDNNRSRLDHLPQSLNQVLDDCLSKKPAKRISSASMLSQQIAFADFTKKCSHCGLTHNYDAVVCNCGANLQDQQEETPAHSPENWLSHTDLPGVIGVDSQSEMKIRIHPALLTDRASAVASGKTVSICLMSKDDPQLEDRTTRELQVKLLPKPVFSVGVSELSVELDPLNERQKVTLPMNLEKSEAIIESIEAFVQDMPDVPVAVVCKAYNRWITPEDNPFEVQLSLDWSMLEVDKPYGLGLKIQLKNRQKPEFINSQSLNRDLAVRVINPPKLFIPPSSPDGKPVPVTATVYRKTDIKIERLKLVNSGGGVLRISRMEVFWKDETDALPDPESFIRFHVPDGGLDVAEQSSNLVYYSISPDMVPADTVSLNLKVSFERNMNGSWEHAVLDRWLVIKCKELSKGTIMAMDFGTTNSCCSAFLQDEKIRNLREFTEEDEDVTDSSIPSVIQYYGQVAPVEIGLRPWFRYTSGELNIFRSFKRDIGNPGMEYSLFPPQDGVIESKSPETLSTDYIHRFVQRAKDQFGYQFNNFVFTHPSNFSMSKLKAFRQVLKDAEIKKYMLLDEATAGALDFISSKQGDHSRQGEYRLAIFDFGGGTIDITYLRVNLHRQSGIELSILDVDGVPNFGGDDVTKAIQNALIDQMLEKHREDWGDCSILTPDAPDSADYTADETRQAHFNAQRLWNDSESMKKEGLFEGEQIKTRYPSLWVKNGASRLVENKTLQGIAEISPEQIYKEILPNLVESIEILVDMVKSDKENKAPLHVVLAGRSSKIPLVSRLFEAFKNGEEAYWDSDQEKVAFRKIETQDAPGLPYEEIELAKRPKAMVARGAAIFGAVQLDRKRGGRFSVKVDQVDGVNWSRLGMLTKVFLTEDAFDEWIPKRRLLTPEPNTKQYSEDCEYAVCENAWKFYFDENGSLEDEIVIYEQIGRGNNPDNSTPVGRFTFKLDDRFPALFLEADGYLRLEITYDLEIHLFALVKDKVLNGIPV